MRVSQECPLCKVTVDKCNMDCPHAEAYWDARMHETGFVSLWQNHRKSTHGCQACTPGPCCCDED
jgi:hypothetical protein